MVGCSEESGLTVAIGQSRSLSQRLNVRPKIDGTHEWYSVAVNANVELYGHILLASEKLLIRLEVEIPRESMTALSFCQKPYSLSHYKAAKSPKNTYFKGNLQMNYSRMEIKRSFFRVGFIQLDTYAAKNRFHVPPPPLRGIRIR